MKAVIKSILCTIGLLALGACAIGPSAITLGAGAPAYSADQLAVYPTYTSAADRAQKYASVDRVADCDKVEFPGHVTNSTAWVSPSNVMTVTMRDACATFGELAGRAVGEK